MAIINFKVVHCASLRIPTFKYLFIYLLTSNALNVKMVLVIISFKITNCFTNFNFQIFILFMLNDLIVINVYDFKLQVFIHLFMLNTLIIKMAIISK